MFQFSFFFLPSTLIKIFLVNVQGLISVTLFSISDCLHFHSFIKVAFEANGSRLAGLILIKCFTTRCSKLPSWTRCRWFDFSGQSLKEEEEGKKRSLPYDAGCGYSRQRKSDTEKVLPFAGVFFSSFFQLLIGSTCLAQGTWGREDWSQQNAVKSWLLNLFRCSGTHTQNSLCSWFIPYHL